MSRYMWLAVLALTAGLLIFGIYKKSSDHDAVAPEIGGQLGPSKHSGDPPLPRSSASPVPEPPTVVIPRAKLESPELSESERKAEATRKRLQEQKDRETK